MIDLAVVKTFVVANFTHTPPSSTSDILIVVKPLHSNNTRHIDSTIMSAQEGVLVDVQVLINEQVQFER